VIIAVRDSLFLNKPIIPTVSFESVSFEPFDSASSSSSSSSTSSVFLKNINAFDFKIYFRFKYNMFLFD
jgi:hypothetical protein